MGDIDHSAHDYSLTENKFIAQKVEDLDVWLDSYLDKLSNNTILIVIGDHGSTERGEHSGNTKE